MSFIAAGVRPTVLQLVITNATFRELYCNGPVMGGCGAALPCVVSGDLFHVARQKQCQEDGAPRPR